VNPSRTGLSPPDPFRSNLDGVPGVSDETDIRFGRNMFSPPPRSVDTEHPTVTKQSQQDSLTLLAAATTHRK